MSHSPTPLEADKWHDDKHPLDCPQCGRELDFGDVGEVTLSTIEVTCRGCGFTWKEPND